MRSWLSSHLLIFRYVRGRGKWWVMAIFILICLTIGLVAWRWPQQLLCVDSGPHPADAIVVLGGDPVARPARAAEIYRAGHAPLVIVSGGEEYRRALLERGVPAEAIRLEGYSRNTKENAEECFAFLQAAGARRVIIVTSWYHSRRARACFRKVAPEMTFFSCPSYEGYRRAEWPEIGNRDHFRSEYLGLLFYWLRYGATPF
jgi:uncharacterized SAM-binding protein YcdF (DUF218 family)